MLALCTPAAVFATRAGTDSISWIVAPDLGDLVHLPVELVGGSVALACALLALAGYAIARSLREPDRWRTGFVAAWLAVPVLLAFVVSWVQPVFVSYYLIVTLPALALLAGAGLARLPGRAAGVAALAAVAALSVVRIADLYASGSLEDYRGVTHRMMGAMRPSDGVVYDPPAVANPVAFYDRRAARPPPGYPPRIWLVMRDAASAERQRVERTTLRGYEHISAASGFKRVTVALYVRRSGPGP